MRNRRGVIFLPERHICCRMMKFSVCYFILFTYEIPILSGSNGLNFAPHSGKATIVSLKISSFSMTWTTMSLNFWCDEVTFLLGCFCSILWLYFEHPTNADYPANSNVAKLFTSADRYLSLTLQLWKSEKTYFKRLHVLKDNIKGSIKQNRYVILCTTPL